ncbi:hypothetical protein HOLleu_01751 [Holothuria leucospilota]|uniref:Uncharacterized protein n=1 Tax=Holothuria leucospilota TaxID=206669 RepID=A0A9Q1CNS9_HOLLE|nr:hypothetical protein HOLleu_01751 [Holothuria leucospilota]
MLMQMQNDDVYVRYKKGKKLFTADNLSRAYLPKFGMLLEGPLEVSVVKELTPLSSGKFEEFKRGQLKIAVVCKEVQEG